MTTPLKIKQRIINTYVPLFSFFLILIISWTPINELHAQEAPVYNSAMTTEIIDTIETLDPITKLISTEIIKYEIHKNVDKIAYFKGCDPDLEDEEFITCSQIEMLNYIYGEVKYPPKARKNKIEGTVVITFTIFSDGSIGSIKTLRSIGSGCDEEAMRVIKSMPNWQPAIHKGSAVNTIFNLPIKFKLQN